MTTTNRTSGNPFPVKIDSRKKPRENVMKIINWGILFKKKPSEEEADETVANLLAIVEGFDFEDSLKTSSLQYQWVKSKDVQELYYFLVYRHTEELTAGNGEESMFESADEVPSRTSGPRVPKPPSLVLEIFDRS